MTDHVGISMVIVFNILLLYKGSIVVVAVIKKVTNVISLVVKMLFGNAHKTQSSRLTHVDYWPDTIHPVRKVTLRLVLPFKGRCVRHRRERGSGRFCLGQRDT